MVSGTDIDGDTWTLRLVGPGSLVVTKQDDASGNPMPLNSESEINSITIAGTEPLVSRLIGTVKKGADGDGKVFFQTLNELPSRSERLTGGQSMLSIDMPDFWLGNTTQVTSSTTALPSAPSITIPDGVSTLDFGGVDTTHDQFTPPSSLASSFVGDQADVDLGQPIYGPTTIIINSSISSTQQVTSTPSGSTTPTTATVQHAVEFNVSGQIKLFQANSIQGDATNTPPQFSNLNSSAPSSSTIGGTVVVSGTVGTAPFLSNGQLEGAASGVIEDLRVGGDATNLTAVVFDATGGGNARISNFSVGGETDNVMVVAPNGMHNAYFGLGMDKTEIFSNVLNTLQANRGALDSTVVTDRTISRATFGGDVEDSKILTGYAQSFSNIINSISGSTSGTPAAPPDPENAETGGGMQVLIAGDVVDSVFAASVQPYNASDPTTPFQGNFGTPEDLVLPSGHIQAKVEGTINNTDATPDQPNKAFYAQAVTRVDGPVTPPNVPEPPYSGPARPLHAPGLHNQFRTKSFTANPKDVSIPSTTIKGAGKPATPVPRGPLSQANLDRAKARTTAK